MKYLVLTFLLVTVVPAQQYEIINSAQGLSQNEVFSIYEDSKGFLWFGTQDGLNRYDGYTFRIYRPQPGNTNSLVDYAINSIAEDRNKNLWIATRDGLNKFNPQTDEFTLYKQNDTNGLSSNYVWKVLADGDDLWIAAREGLDKLHIPSGTFSHYKSDSADVNSISNKIVRDMLREGNTLWSATMNGLNALDLETGIVKKFFHVPGDIKNLSSRSLDCLAFDRRFGIWAGSANGLNLVRFDGSVNSFSFFGTGELNYILDILVDQSGILWLGTRGGIVNFNPLDGSYRKYSDINDIVRVLHQDRSGIIWAGSIGKGIIKVNTDPSRCGITGNFQGPVYSFYEDENGRILAGGRGSILVFKNNLVFSEYKKAVTPDNIFSIVSDNKENYLAGTFGGGISVYDRYLRPLKRITASDFPGFSNNFIHAIYRDRKGVLWIGTGQGGLVMYREKENDFVSFQTDPGNSESINSNEVTCITEDDKGFLWLGTTTGGINKFDPLKGTFTGYIHDQENEKSVTSNRINTLFIDRNNNLWAGTFGGGLLKLIGDNEFRHYGSDDGLNGNSVFSIEEDDSGNLWMSTEKGISLFDPASGVFTNFDAADGLQDGNFYANSSIKTSGGYMVFGGSGGINYFHPDSIKNSSYLSPVVFTDFRVFNNSVPVGKHDGNDFYLDKNISYREEIEIPWNKNVFSLEFSSLHYAYPAKNMYAYKMEGFDNDWIYSGTRRFVTYTNLDPGNYIFRVRGTNSDGVWNPVESLLQIKIIPPWWKTWWAYILYTLVLAAVLYIFRKYEMHRIKLKN